MEKPAVGTGIQADPRKCPHCSRAATAINPDVAPLIRGASALGLTLFRQLIRAAFTCSVGTTRENGAPSAARSGMHPGAHHHKLRSVLGQYSLHAVLLALGLLLAGCAAGDHGPASESDVKALALAATSSPRLQPGEKIRVTVYGEASLSGDYQIDPSGFVSLPLAGTVRAAGLTQNELEQELSKKFRSEYLRNPKVTVSITEFKPFYIIGEVEKPGAYPYTSGLNVLSAIAIAGGTTYRASKTTILIQHPGETGLREYPATAATPILSGDIIKVPQRYF